MSKKKEYDINRTEYDKKVEEIRVEKRSLRNVQEPGLVKKIKKDLKVTQRGAKRSDKQELNKYIKDQIEKFGDEEDFDE